VQRIDDVANKSEGVGGQLAKVVSGKVGEAFYHHSKDINALVVLKRDIDSIALRITIKGNVI
jgi:hypothetical protein